METKQYNLNSSSQGRRKTSIVSPPTGHSQQSVGKFTGMPIITNLKMAEMEKAVEANKKLRSDNDQLNAEKVHMEGSLKQASTTIMNLTKELDKALDESSHKDTLIRRLKKDVSDKDAKIGTLENANTGLLGQLKEAQETLDRSARKGSNKKASADALEKLNSFVKGYLFRIMKFARDKQLKACTKEVYHAIQPQVWADESSDNYVSEEEFVEIYEPHVSSALSNCRQYKQSMLFKAVEGKSESTQDINILCMLH